MAKKSKGNPFAKKGMDMKAKGKKSKKGPASASKGKMSFVDKMEKADAPV